VASIYPSAVGVKQQGWLRVAPDGNHLRVTSADSVLPSHARITALGDRTVDPGPRTRLANMPFAMSNSSVGRPVAEIDQPGQHEGRCGKAPA
jgi:hypothetical protein